MLTASQIITKLNFFRTAAEGTQGANAPMPPPAPNPDPNAAPMDMGDPTLVDQRIRDSLLEAIGDDLDTEVDTQADPLFDQAKTDPSGKPSGMPKTKMPNYEHPPRDRGMDSDPDAPRSLPTDEDVAGVFKDDEGFDAEIQQSMAKQRRNSPNRSPTPATKPLPPMSIARP